MGGVNVNLNDGKNILFIIICYYGYFDIVEMFIEVGVEVNLDDGEFILLKVVDLKGYMDIVKILIEKGVDDWFIDDDLIDYSSIFKWMFRF